MSVAATAPGHHVVVLLQHNVLVVVEVEQVDGVELVGHAAGRIDALGEFEGVDDGLTVAWLVGRMFWPRGKGQEPLQW